MKILQKMLLINWHYLRHELLDFKQINFLTGKNGAGKSTIVDALQLILLGDTSGYYFNKAANDKSARSLKGYLRGEVAEDENANTVYLREGDFSSYLVLEFLDDVEKRSFCLGVILDSYRDGSYKHQFFYLKNPLPSHHFYQQRIPMNIKQLKAYCQNHYPKQYQFFETNKDYQEVMTGVLGHLNEKFFRLFKKAVPFSPIMDIKGFITEFVCDIQNAVDITDMQENIRQYKQLEEELGVVEKRIAVLEEIKEQYRLFKEEEERLFMQQYLLDRAGVEKASWDVTKIQKDIDEVGAKILILEKEIDKIQEELEFLQKTREQLWQEKVSSNVYQKQEELKRENDYLVKELKEIANSEQQLGQILEKHYRNWKETIQWAEKNLVLERNFTLHPKEQVLVQLDLLQRSLHQSFHLLDENKLYHLRWILTDYAQKMGQIYWQLHSKQQEHQRRITKLNQEIEGLKKGIKPYSITLLELKETITEKLSEKYRDKVELEIFAELLEIKNEKWQQAIEGYLHTQKFYLLVEPKYFAEALKIYDQLKFSRKFYDLGLVDLGKIMQEEQKILPGSLAEEIETSNRLARAYANFLLGRVMKCENLEDLRKYRTAITPTCMLYQNYVARQLNPQRYETPYLGRKAVALLIKQKEKQLSEETKLETELVSFLRELEKYTNKPQLTENDIANLLSLKEKVANKKELEDQQKKIMLELENLDLS